MWRPSLITSLQDLSLRYYPDPALRVKCTACTWTMEERTRIGKDMIRIMFNKEGYGLAAPQVGLDQRIFVMRDPNSMSGLIISNPVITNWGPKKLTDWEGCLSLLGQKAKLSRCTDITVEFDDPVLEGKRFCKGFSGLAARCVQHEIDHLDGILIFDHLQSNLAKKIFLEKYAKARKKYARLG